MSHCSPVCSSVRPEQKNTYVKKTLSVRCIVRSSVRPSVRNKNTYAKEPLSVRCIVCPSVKNTYVKKRLSVRRIDRPCVRNKDCICLGTTFCTSSSWSVHPEKKFSNVKEPLSVRCIVRLSVRSISPHGGVEV